MIGLVRFNLILKGAVLMSQMKKTSGVALAMAAAALLSTGFIATPAQAATAKVHCQGVNGCKGKSECKTADNACKGQNSCKGKGWVSLSKAKCVKKGGTVAE